MANITVYKGDTYTHTIRVLKEGAPVSLTGATVVLTVKNEDTDNDASKVLQVTGTLKDQTTNPGECYFEFTTSDLDVTAKTYVYDIEVDIGSGTTRKTVAKGDFIVLQDVYHHA